MYLTVTMTVLGFIPACLLSVADLRRIGTCVIQYLQPALSLGFILNANMINKLTALGFLLVLAKTDL